MKKFNGKCPRCTDDSLELVGVNLWNEDVAILELECISCGVVSIVSYKNPFIVEEV